MNNKKGFTLVELLVVIGIIGILSSVIMASLGAARIRAQDAKVKAQLVGAHENAELYFDSYNTYNGFAGDVADDCATIDSMFQDTEMLPFMDVTNNYPPGTTMRCSSTATEFVISASMSDQGEFWCVDSSGNKEIITGVDHETAHPSGATACH